MKNRLFAVWLLSLSLVGCASRESSYEGTRLNLKSPKEFVDFTRLTAAKFEMEFAVNTAIKDTLYEATLSKDFPAPRKSFYGFYARIIFDIQSKEYSYNDWWTHTDRNGNSKKVKKNEVDAGDFNEHNLIFFIKNFELPDELIEVPPDTNLIEVDSVIE